MIILLAVGFMKKVQLYKISYFAEPFIGKYKMEVELDLSNYATKSDIKNATEDDTLQFTLKKMIS